MRLVDFVKSLCCYVISNVHGVMWRFGFQFFLFKKHKYGKYWIIYGEKRAGQLRFVGIVDFLNKIL